MNQNMVNGLIRAVLAGVGGVLGGKGMTDSEAWAQVSGAIFILIAAVWSLVEKKKITLPPAAPLMIIGLLGLTLSSGCASIIATSAHDRDVDTQIKVIKAMPVSEGTGIGIGIDLLGLNKGYFAAWKDEPKMMASAFGMDFITTLGAAYLATRQNSGSSGSSITIEGNGNQLTTGDNSPVSKTKTTTSTAE